ncbi:MAG: aldo/keto reductase [Brevibacterium yomogidense]|uniref:Putative oxidoreductase n=1 Tax=Brevibacterium yomogidense TaxID=946573 RepID=A0A1X6XCZ5_9MICO|nr:MULTISPECIES: aldo/keto reductase [Brevibacterium]SLM97111.1 putative oxidoreductase [Brevibacterium yomogidense]SMX67219.1 Predicted oxidoreductase [Brevibacterium sp. Mu109]
MHSNRMGNTGLQVSDLSLGTFEWGRRVDEATARELLDAYASAGGTALELPAFDAPAVGLVTGMRIPSRVQLLARVGVRATEAGGPPQLRTGRSDLLTDVRTLLGALDRDHLDVLVLDAFDDQIPVEESASVLRTLVDAGDVGYVLLSHHSAWQLSLRAADSGLPFAGAIAEYSLLRRDAEASLRPALDYLGLGLIAGAGLGRGVLSGQYLRGLPTGSRGAGDLGGYVGELLDDDTTGVVQGVVKAATALGVDPIDIALAWNRRSLCASTIVSPRTRAQLDQLLASDLELADEISEVLDQISDPCN